MERWKDGKKLGKLKHEVGGSEFVLLLLTKLVGFFFSVGSKAITSVLN